MTEVLGYALSLVSIGSETVTIDPYQVAVVCSQDLNLSSTYISS